MTMLSRILPGALLAACLLPGSTPAQAPKPAAGKASIGPIEPPKLDQDRVERMLSDSVADVAVGGGGRFLILHQPKARKLAVFDVNAADVVQSIPADDDQVLFAAGAEKLLVVLVNAGLVQRYSLATFQREASVPLPIKAKVEGVYLGSASKGPMLVAAKAVDGKPVTFFVELTRLRVVPVLPPPGKKNYNFGGGPFVRVSANNHTFASWRPDTSPQGMTVMALLGGRLGEHYEHDTFGHLDPSPNGQIIYTARGPYTPEGKSLSKAPKGRGAYVLPATEGDDYYLSIDLEGRRARQLNVHFVGDERVLASPDVELPGDVNPWDREPLGTDKRIFFIPAANLIVTLPSTNDRLVLHRFDLDEALKKTDLNYLIVASRPPASVRRGSVYRYALVVKSKQGGLTYRVETGPKGLSVSDQGEVKWPVSGIAGPGARNVVIAIKDGSGQETFHRFTIYVRE